MDPTLQTMNEELEIRGYSPRTVVCYMAQVRAFLRHTGKEIDELEKEDVRRYMAYLKIKKGLAGSTVNQAMSAIRFLFIDILGQDWNAKQFRCHKRRRKLPIVLSRQEVAKLFEVTTDLKHRAAFMAMYSAGLRIEETAHLQPTDIDSQYMRIHVRNGKGQKERLTVLSPKLLETLREYWRTYRPKEWLFFGADKRRPIGSRTLQRGFARSRDIAGIRKPATPHSLRHSFATHLLESGTNIRYIQELLGHRFIQSTLIYLQVTPKSTSEVQSPLDQLSWT